ncbi:MAG: polyprenol monophosphomannose synthase [Candidatus Promineifilaceae bacterium]
MEKIVVVIPTYNEADNLPIMTAELQALGIPNLSILFVDDNSPDGTGRIADEMVARQPNKIQVIHNPAKGGLGRAYRIGFKAALEGDADFIIQMDCDFSHSPSHIPEMLEKIKQVDVVVGSRYIAGGKLDERWETGRYLLSWWANAIYTRVLLGLDVKDTTAGFKCWRAAALRGIDLDRISSNGYSFQFEMAYVAQRLGYRIVEIPIYFEDRRIGRSKLTIPIKIEAAIKAWQILWRYRDLTPEMRQPEQAIQPQDAHQPDS